MKRKLLAGFMAVCLILTLLPATAMAVDEGDVTTAPDGNTGTMATVTTVSSEQDLRQAIENAVSGATIQLTQDIQITPVDSGRDSLNPHITIDTDLTLNLNGHKISWDLTEVTAETSFTCGLVIFCVDGADVTITGNGTIDAEARYNDSYGINIINNGSVTVENGTYTGATTAIQVQKGTLTVLGGTFKQAETIDADDTNNEFAKYVINCIDSAYKNGTARIYAKGGVFCFDPSNLPENSDVTYVPVDYMCTNNGNGTWTVSKKNNMSVVKPTYATSSTVNATVSGVTIPESDPNITTGAGSTLTINAEANTSATTANVTVGGEALKVINSAADVGDVVIKTDVGDMTITEKALSDIVTNASAGDTNGTVSDITLSIEKTGSITSNTATTETYTLTAVDTLDREVFATGMSTGEISITVPYTGTAACVYYLDDDGPVKLDAEDVSVSGGYLTWTVSHFSDYVVTQQESGAFATTSGGTTAYTNLDALLTALQNDGISNTYTIQLVTGANNNLTSANYTINDKITIKGGSIEATTKSDGGLNNKAFTIVDGGALTLDGTNMTVRGTAAGESDGGQYNGIAFNMKPNSDLTVQNGAVLNITGLNRGIVADGDSAPIDADITVTGTGSKLIATNFDGNFSQGGDFVIEEAAEVSISNCVDHGLSANTVEVNGATLSVSNTGKRGISINENEGKLWLRNLAFTPNAPDATVTVTNCGSADHPAVYLADDATAGKYAALVMAGETTLSVTANVAGKNAEISLSTSSSVTNILTGTIIGDFVGGEAMIGGKVYETLEEAVAAVQPNQTINLLDDVTVSDKLVIDDANVTLNGNGHSITVSTTAAFTGTNHNIPPVNSVLEVTADNVTIQNVQLVGTDGKTKHGVQFYEAEGGKLSGVTVKDTAWTGVLVNGSKVTIENSALNPSGSAVYATIEYSMGDQVTTVPEIHLNNVTTNSSKGFVIWADNATVNRVNGTSATAAAETIRNSITTENNVAVTVSIDVNNNPDSPVNTTKPSTKPIIPSYGGGSSSSSGSYIVSVDSGKNGSVSVTPGRADRGDTVTITVKPDAGYELGRLTVTDKDGDAVSVKSIGANKYTFTMPAGKVTVAASFVEQREDLPFVDVAPSAYYYDAVAWAVDNGVTGGMTPTTFAPSNPCTRAQTVTFLWRAAGCPTPRTAVNPFTDVKATDYYYEAVLWAVENGITGGTTSTTFSPASTCTRAQVVTFLYRYSKDEASALPMFADVAENDYYYGAVAWAVENGVTTGVTETAFQPGNPCTRGQIVTFLYRYMGE